MGKKSKNRKLKRKKLKSNKNKDNSNFEKDKSNSNKEFRPKKNLALIHKRKEFKRKLKKIKKKNKKLFNVEHEYLDELDDIFMNQDDIERLPHDKFVTFPIPNSLVENKIYLSSIISDSDIILELLDSRDIIHSRNKELEDSINKSENKILIYVLTKTDLVSNDYLLKIKNILQKENNNLIITVSSLKRETIQFFLDELKKIISKLNLKKLIKIGIIGAPNVGKNSLVQSLELIINSNCLEKYIFFEDEKNFCINSVPCAIFDEKEENNFLISKKCKNIKDIKEPKKLLDNLMNTVNINLLKDVYDLEKVPENLDEFISAIRLKYEFENDDLSSRKILDDIIRGKIKYEIEINDN
jgi:ribosome biogenesis GTPase A